MPENKAFGQAGGGTRKMAGYCKSNWHYVSGLSTHFAQKQFYLALHQFVSYAAFFYCIRVFI